MAEIGKGHDHVAPHPRHLVQHLAWVQGFLQSLGQNHVVESAVGIIRQALINIALKHGNAAGDGAFHLLPRDFHAARVHALVNGQPLQQLGFAAAEVEHLGAIRHDLADDGVVAAAQQIAYECGLQRRPRRGRHPTLSRVLARNPRTRSVWPVTSTRNASCP